MCQFDDGLLYLFKAWCAREYSVEGADIVYQHYLDKRVYPQAFLDSLCGCCNGTGKIRESEFVDGDLLTCMTCNGSGM